MLEENAGDIRYSIIEIITKRCLQTEIKIQRKEFDAATKDAKDIFTFIKNHEAYFENKEYTGGFQYVAKCLAIRSHMKLMQKECESKRVNMSELKKLLKNVNEYQHFGAKQQVGVLAIKQYFAGNLRKSDYDFQLKIIRDVSVYRS